MKICLLGDTHFGVRNGSTSFSNYFEKFYSNVFFPYLINNNITKVVQFGDIFDNRKMSHIQGLSECKKYFFSKFSEFDIELITLIGNHDSFYKDTIKINSPKLLLGEFSNIKIIEEPSLIDVGGGNSVVILPWICKENYEQSMRLIENPKTDICFGHLELSEFSMHKGIVSDEGMSPSLFDSFSFVGTGHYHHRSNRGNIYYLGTPYELTWHDNSDPKGFHIFDFNSRELEFIQNPFRMFNKIYYDDLLNEEELKQNLSDNYYEKFSNSYIKLIVKNKENLYLFDNFVDKLYQINPLDLVIIEEVSEVLTEELSDIDETEDTITILSKYVENLKTKDLDQNKVKGILHNLYNEAISLDTI